MFKSKWQYLSLFFVVVLQILQTSIGSLCDYYSTLRYFITELLSVRKTICSVNGLNNSILTEIIHSKINSSSNEMLPVVTNFTLNNLTSNLVTKSCFIINLKYNNEKLASELHFPTSLFVKTLCSSMKDKLIQVLTQLHRSESLFYLNIVNQSWFPKEIVPKIYFSNYNHFTSDYILIMENLDGYTFESYQTKGNNIETIKITLDQLIKLHISGYSFLQNCSTLQKRELIDFQKIYKRNDILLVNVASVLSNKRITKQWEISKVIDDRFISISKRMSKNQYRFECDFILCDLFPQLLTFVHRDCHPANIAIKREKDEIVDVKYVDWQMCGVGIEPNKINT